MTAATEEFIRAQQQVLDHFGVAGRSRFLAIDALSGPAHALVAGDGPPVVMVPGFADPAAMWVPLVASLPGFTCHAVDRPCFGLSGRAEHRTSSLRTLAVSFLEQVLDALQLDRAIFVANSMGSLWSIWLALDRPSRVTAMVHVGCPAFTLDTSAPFPMRLMSVEPIGRALMRMSPPSRKQVEQFARLVGEDLSANPAIVDLLVAAQRLPGAQRSIRALLRAVVRVRGARPQVRLTAEQLANITQPVALLWGTRDVFGSVETGRAAAALIPGAEFHLIEDGGHIPWVQQPEAVASVARPFLQTQAGVH